MTAQDAKPFADKVAVVTGASSGIGKAAALEFAAAGAAVVVAARRSTLGEDVVAQIRSRGGEAWYVHTDVTRPESVEQLVRSALARYGRLDFAFNNAGIPGQILKPAAEHTEESWHDVIATNLTGVWLCMKHEIPAMLRGGGGVIVNNASDVGLTASDLGIAPYVASKHGVIGLTRSAAIDYARQGVRVNAVCPGMTYSEMLEPALRDPGALDEWVNARVPMARIAEAVEIARAVLWLCSPASSFVTGHALAVDGGGLAM
jgi:A-factor type gamma-butyrolactone 1'-reductase (1S-forming)